MTHSQSRRRFLTSALAATAGVSWSGWFPGFAKQVALHPERRRHCILLWMSGGPSQTDTFDMKVNHENGGEFSEIQTCAPGLRFSEHLPQLATMADRLAVVRGLSTKEGDHGRGTYLMRTGRKPMGPIRFPCIGASLTNQLGRGIDDAGLPGYVSVGPYRVFNQDAYSPGFLGPRFGPLIVGAADMIGAPENDADGFPLLRVQGLDRSAGITEARMSRRLDIWQQLQANFVETHSEGPAQTHHTVYQGAVRLMNSDEASAFNLDDEPQELREAYGSSVFGQGCMLARRLVERGASFVEVSLGTTSGGVGWDTHADNFNAVRRLSQVLDAGWATLMTDLEQRGLLESTTILWMGEFGRTPQINGSQGRDHFPSAWSCVFAGGGIAGGQAYGKTSEDGTEVIDDPVGEQDVLATLCEAVGVPPDTMQMSNTGRPLPISEGVPIQAVLA